MAQPRSASNSNVLVISRFLIATPFLISCAFIFFDQKGAGGTGDLTGHITGAFVEGLKDLLGEPAAKWPWDKAPVMMAVVQGMGGFLIVMNHKFGGVLLMLYTVITTLVTHQFWLEGALSGQISVLFEFFQNVAIMGGILAFISTTDEVPLKLKRVPLE
ncbi:hypothetical protein TSOC_008738 [Tetrabaena socialis]|uniref:DoxX family protein n=1 Tax=Tetrabaena socialis TaxID=47790 RepID=A0A2J7ZXQ5_9CHLO|nr:hypothetical protein TSOC_008738 [Tetrabaena socialis]|eukprot:PNH05046.1 hypothetical protein TSOC_008738 [Tetrabaena socialis]